MYENLVLSVVMCGAEYCSLVKEDEHRISFSVAEMGWVRRPVGVSMNRATQECWHQEPTGQAETLLQKIQRNRLS